MQRERFELSGVTAAVAAAAAIETASPHFFRLLEALQLPHDQAANTAVNTAAAAAAAGIVFAGRHKLPASVLGSWGLPQRFGIVGPWQALK